jgi:8-amino-7-oxononanoate synthase
VSWQEWARSEGDAIRGAGRWREPRTFDAIDVEGTLPDGAKVVSFAANDYLGLRGHPAVVAAAHEALDRWGAGSGAARLIVGSRPVHDRLEEELADWKATAAAVLFSTGFMANVGVLATLGARPGALVVSDELNHASIIDGTRLAKARVAVYRHGDAEHAASIVADHDGPALVVTDAVFSMDGDVAPIAPLAEICVRHDAVLVLDEAHVVLEPLPATGEAEVVRIGTLSKTLGALGGFAAADRHVIDLLVNRARSYVFTTALSPADTAAARAALGVLRSAEGDGLVARLRRNVDRLVPGYPSPIVPVVVGDEGAAAAAAARLLRRGLLVPAIRPPTVPPGSSRLRIALSASHTDEQLDALIEGLDADVPGWRE